MSWLRDHTAHLHVQAVNKYQRLAAVLRGEHRQGMLPPVPRGYVATRLQQLAGMYTPLSTPAALRSSTLLQPVCCAWCAVVHVTCAEARSSHRSPVEACSNKPSLNAVLKHQAGTRTAALQRARVSMTSRGTEAAPGRGSLGQPDLPTDSALIFYIFAAYLEAPRCAVSFLHADRALGATLAHVAAQRLSRSSRRPGAQLDPALPAPGQTKHE